jgi:hypothetical protein
VFIADLTQKTPPDLSGGVFLQKNNKNQNRLVKRF